MKRKLIKMGKGQIVIPTMLAVMAASNVKVTFAQDDLLSQTDDVLSSEQIDIDGHFRQKPKPTAADRLANMRKKLEERNENMVQKKIEDMRMQEEKKLSRKLRHAFNDDAMSDEVEVSQSSVEKVQAPAPETSEKRKSLRVIPNIGMTTIKSDVVDFESNLGVGVGVEADINDHFSAGVNLRYSSVDITDLGAYNNYNYYYNQGYYNYFGSRGRELNYKQVGLDVNSKFFFTTTRVRPYVGLGLGLNRSSLKYASTNGQNPYQYYNGSQAGNEEYTSSYLAGTGLLGAQIAFTETVGIAAEFNYTKGVAGLSKTQSKQSSFNPDQQRLEDIGKSIEDASMYGLNIGLMVSF